MALAAAGLFEIKLGISVGEKFFDAFTMSIVNGDADARGKPRVFRVTGHDGTDTVGYALGFILQSFW